MGSLGSWIGLSAAGPRFGLDLSRMMPGESPLCLSSLVHAEQLWLPAPGWLGNVSVELVAEGSGQPAPAPPLPSLEQLSDRLASWCERQLGDPGILAVPQGWRQLHLAARLLAPWAQRGWRFASLEPLVAARHGGNPRVITSDGPFLRVQGPVAQLVMPSSAEAAGALTLAAEVLARMLQQAGPTVASHWRQHEQQRQEPLVRALLARKLLQALRLGAHALSIGGADAPLFFAPAPGAPAPLRSLHDHRFRVFLPRLPELDWWTKVTEAGFLRSDTGRVLIFGLDWKAVPTVEIEGPSSPWDLPALLERQGASRTALRAHQLHGIAPAGEPLEAWFPSWRELMEVEEQAAAPPPAPAPEPQPAPPPPGPPNAPLGPPRRRWKRQPRPRPKRGPSQPHRPRSPSPSQPRRPRSPTSRQRWGRQPRPRRAHGPSPSPSPSPCRCPTRCAPSGPPATSARPGSGSAAPAPPPPPPPPRGPAPPPPPPSVLQLRSPTAHPPASPPAGLGAPGGGR